MTKAWSVRRAPKTRGVEVLVLLGVSDVVLLPSLLGRARASWASLSTWKARVSSLRAIAVVAIFLPRRRAIAV